MSPDTPLSRDCDSSVRHYGSHGIHTPWMYQRLWHRYTWQQCLSMYLGDNSTADLIDNTQKTPLTLVSLKAPHKIDLGRWEGLSAELPHLHDLSSATKSSRVRILGFSSQHRSHGMGIITVCLVDWSFLG